MTFKHINMPLLAHNVIPKFEAGLIGRKRRVKVGAIEGEDWGV